MTDNCNETEQDSKCNNLEESYESTYDQYTGYNLTSDDTTCEDIWNTLKCTSNIFSSDVSECEEGDHLCTELCINIPGSYDCSCPIGYAL